LVEAQASLELERAAVVRLGKVEYVRSRLVDRLRAEDHTRAARPQPHVTFRRRELTGKHA
jgi:hypothetical protein